MTIEIVTSSEIFSEQINVPKARDIYAFETNCNIREAYVEKAIQKLRWKYDLEGRRYVMYLIAESRGEQDHLPLIYFR